MARRLASAGGRVGLWCSTLLALGCGAVPGEPLAQETQAVNVCDETVPDNRYVDGLPAYAQCDATTGSIWSNNGIDTATSSGGSDWVRTQQGGGYQCTEWAFRYMHFRWDIDYRHGDAREWCDGDLPATLALSTLPVHGDLIVFDGGSCGADETTGHIAVVDAVDAAKAKVTIVEENRAGRRSTDQSCAKCFLHAVANDGATAGTAGAGGSGTAGAAGTAGTTSAGGSNDGGTSGSGGATATAGGNSGGRSSGAGTGASEGGSSGDGGGAAGASAGRGGERPVGGAGMGGTSTMGQAGTGSAGRASGAGGSGTGASGGTAGHDATSSAGTSGTEGDDLLLTETNEDGGCAVQPPRGGDRGFGLILALLGLAAHRRRLRSRAPDA